MVQSCPTVTPCAKGYPLTKLALLLLSFFAFNLSAFAQPPGGAILAKNYGTSYVDSVKAWSDPNAWVGGVVPGSGDVVYIINSVVVMDTDVEVAAVVVEPYGYLYLYDVNDEAALTIDAGSTQYTGTGNGHTLTVTDYVKLTHNVGWKAGDDATKGSTLVLNSSTAVGGAGNETIRGTKAFTSWNVEVPSGATVDFNSGGEAASMTILNKLSMTGGTVTGNAPTYGAASTLSYETAETVGTEWTHSATTGQGVPQDVSVAASSSLNMGTSSNNYTLRGDLSVDAATSALDLSGMDGNLTVEGNMTLGASGSSTLTFTSTEGKGDLIVDGNLTIGASGTISGTQGDLKVGGNLAHSGTGGTFNYVEFNGGIAQTVNGPTAMTIDSLVVDNSEDDTTLLDDDVTFATNSTIEITPGGVFNPVDGSVYIQGTFTMKSNATGTARIATLANAAATSDVEGDITFERYIPADDGVTWLSAGNYVVGATLGDWSSSFGSDFFLAFQWDETHILNNNASSNGASWWSTLSGDATVLEDSDYGYYILTMPNSNPTLTASGGYNTAQVDLNLTLSAGAFENGGWHLLTNPFPSPIDGTEFLSDNSGRVSAYQLYNNTTDVFTISGATAPGTIDVGQSFWVQVGSAGTVSFELDQLTHDVNSFVRMEDLLEEALVGIRIEQPDGKFGQTFIRFHEEGSEDFEWEHDVTFKESGDNANPEVYSQLANGHELSINSPGTIADTESLFLVVESGSEGTVSLMLDEEFPLPSGMCMLIQDLETGDKAGLGGEPLVVELEPFTVYEERFELVIMDAPEFEATASHCEGGVVHFNGEDAGLWEIQWSDVAGSIDGTGCVTGLDAGDYVFEASNPLNQCFTMSNLSIPEVCMGDFNFNGERDITDLLMLLVGIQPVENFEGSFPEADCDCDGVMTTLDLLMFLPQFGNNCE